MIPANCRDARSLASDSDGQSPASGAFSRCLEPRARSQVVTAVPFREKCVKMQHFSSAAPFQSSCSQSANIAANYSTTTASESTRSPNVRLVPRLRYVHVATMRRAVTPRGENHEIATRTYEQGPDSQPARPHQFTMVGPRTQPPS